MIKRIHYSKKPLKKVYSINVRRQRINPKPTGLWYSVEGVGNGWKSWCEAGQFAVDRFKSQTEIFVDFDLIKVISSVDELDAFHEEFHDYIPGTQFGQFINWIEVTEQYSGIEIAPYQWDRRLSRKCLWYYGWDCASGCIWDKQAINIAPKLNID